MPIALEITLILVLIALAVGLVPLLFQLRRTAQGLDLFLLSSKQDLSQIAADIHASRMRIDHLMGSIENSSAEFSALASLIGEVRRSAQDLHTRCCNNIESVSRIAGGLIGGIGAVLSFFKSKQTPHEPEQGKKS